jgi:hypothetical protein
MAINAGSCALQFEETSSMFMVFKGVYVKHLFILGFTYTASVIFRTHSCTTLTIKIYESYVLISS